jgi:hypothetical protein
MQTSIVSGTAMADRSPQIDPLAVPIKINTYMVEAALRNDELSSLYTWLWLRAWDVATNLQATGRVYDIHHLVTQLAQQTNRSTKTVRRHIQRADEDGYIVLDRERDCISIKSRQKLTYWLWRMDATDENRSLPDMHMRHPDDVLALNVVLPEVWTPEGISAQRSRIMGVVRQRATEYGWCRETLAKLVGMDRTSTTRLDRRFGVRRGWQFAFISVAELTHHRLTESEQKDFAVSLLQHSKTGRGQKVWLGQSPDGSHAIFTQLPVKWDTRFAGRFRTDRDFKEMVARNAPASLMAGCSALRSNRAVTDSRVSKPEVSTTTLSESMRESLWRAIKEAISFMGNTTPINAKPTINLMESVHWQRWTARSPNPIPPVTAMTERPGGSNSIFEN